MFFSAADGNLRGVVCGWVNRSTLLDWNLDPLHSWVGTCDRQMLNVIHRVVSVSRYDGIGCIDYVVGTDGRPMLFDLNARACASMSSYRMAVGTALRAWGSQTSLYTGPIGPVILNEIFCGLVGCV